MVEPLPSRDVTQSTVHLDDLFGDGEPEASPAFGHGVRAVDLMELLEDPHLMLFGDVRPSVCHGDGEVAIRGCGAYAHLSHIGDFLQTPPSTALQTSAPSRSWGDRMVEVLNSGGCAAWTMCCKTVGIGRLQKNTAPTMPDAGHGAWARTTCHPIIAEFARARAILKKRKVSRNLVPRGFFQPTQRRTYVFRQLAAGTMSRGARFPLVGARTIGLGRLSEVRAR